MIVLVDPVEVDTLIDSDGTVKGGVDITVDSTTDKDGVGIIAMVVSAGVNVLRDDVGVKVKEESR